MNMSYHSTSVNVSNLCSVISTKTESEIADKAALTSATPRQPTEYLARILIPFPAAGLIIGRGGDHIRQIRQLHNCKMRVGDNEDRYGTRERMVSLYGDNSDSVVKVS